LNLEIRDEMMVLLGPSGCGKTASLRVLAGLESISGGEIYIGPLVNDVPPRHRDAAMVFQNYALYPHMTVAQTIGIPIAGALSKARGDCQTGPPGGQKLLRSTACWSAARANCPAASLSEPHLPER
jgi:ABC-type sugar transport system ATPase subunit